MITIVDYGMGNLGAILNMLNHLGHAAQISSRAEEVRAASKLILPGVGAFDAGMRNLTERGLRAALDEAVTENRTPILGICLGMQLLSHSSEEGMERGLGWIDAQTVRFRLETFKAELKVPHMGWNILQSVRSDPLLAGLDQHSRFYFVHSYHLVCRDPADVLGRTIHGYEFTSIVRRGHIQGTQFHPEKSHRFGMKLLGNFARS
jgi:imidazole glycerol-phosphate synthase subunit HisH